MKKNLWPVYDQIPSQSNDKNDDLNDKNGKKEGPANDGPVDPTQGGEQKNRKRKSSHKDMESLGFCWTWNREFDLVNHIIVYDNIHRETF